jgi:hypothetical protein
MYHQFRKRLVFLLNKEKMTQQILNDYIDLLNQRDDLEAKYGPGVLHKSTKKKDQKDRQLWNQLTVKLYAFSIVLLHYDIEV